MKIAPGIHRIGAGLVNSYLIEDSSEVTIVDVGAPGYWNDLPSELAAMGRAFSDVRALVLTDRAFRSIVNATPSVQGSVMKALAERLHADSL